MRLSAHQPAYLPWLGYLDKIDRADIFVYLDAVQYEKNSFTNRNRIKTPQGTQWLTVPVKKKGHMSSTICELEIDNNIDWRQKHTKSIAMNYSKASEFQSGYPFVEQLIFNDATDLASLCWAQLCFWLKHFKIDTKIVRLSELPAMRNKSDLIIDLCKYFEVDSYLSGELGRNYLNEKEFNELRVSIEYQKYISPAYTQLWGEFLPNLSVVDYFLNTGSKNIHYQDKEAL